MGPNGWTWWAIEKAWAEKYGAQVVGFHFEGLNLFELPSDAEAAKSALSAAGIDASGHDWDVQESYRALSDPEFGPVMAQRIATAGFDGFAHTDNRYAEGRGQAIALTNAAAARATAERKFSMQRAYSLLTIKEVDNGRRIIRGTATTPSPDRMGDIVDPLGCTFKNPLPLLHQHDHHAPVGTVKFDKPTKDGIEFEAELPVKVDSPKLQERIDLAWAELKARLLRGVSIGFKSLEHAFMANGGIHFVASEILELSLVTIPANADCTFQQIKSIDSAIRAASGIQDVNDRPVPPASREKAFSVSLSNTAKEANTVNIKEQIKALETKRDAHSARMLEIQTAAAGAGRTKTQQEQEEFDNLNSEMTAIKRELVDLAVLDVMNLAQATPVSGQAPAAASLSRDPAPVHRQVQVVQPGSFVGQGFIRMVSALAQAKGNRSEAAQIADKWKDSTPQVANILRMPSDIIERAAVDAGNTTNTTFAAPLVQYQILANEFIEYLRPLSIIGRINGFRRVPFKVKVPRQTGGATVNWVGEGKVKPVTSLAFDTVSLDFNKIAGIIPITEELVRLSSPSAELLVRNDLADSINQFMDRGFIDPTIAATDVSPASITNGLTAITATGTTAAAFRADVKSMFAQLLAANVQIGGGVWVMTQQQALGLSLMVNGVGGQLFPGISPLGGTLVGFPVVVSENIPAVGSSPTDGYPITFILPQEILLADDGAVNIDVSREASLQMETTPDSPATASTTLVSLWQHNMIGIKAERFVTWLKRRANAAAYIQGAKYAE